MQDFPESCLRQVDPNRNYLWDWILVRGRAGGLLLGLRLDRFDMGNRKRGTYILQHNLWDKLMEKKWDLLNIYGPPQDEHKDEFLTELATFCSRNKEPYLEGGDFNILSFFSYKKKTFILTDFLIRSMSLSMSMS
jgi:hypothetical protein